MTVQYKTRLNELLMELTKEDYDKAMEDLPRRLKIGKKMFYKLRTYPLDSSSCMSVDQAVVIADYFKISLDYLLRRSNSRLKSKSSRLKSSVS